MASLSDGFWRRARCSSSTASAPLPTAVWASARVLRAPVKLGSISSARWMGRDGFLRPAGKVQHEAQHVLQHGALGRELQRLPGAGDRLLVMAEPAQRQRAVAQDLAAAGGIVAGIDQGHVQHLDRGPVVAHAIKRVAQHVARPRLQRLQAFHARAAFFDRLVDVAHELAELALGGGEAALVHMDGGERQPRLDMGRRPADGVAEAPRRLVEVAQPSRHQAEIVGQHRLVGVLGDRLAPHALGVAERAALRQADGEEMQDVGPLAVARQGRAEQRLGTIEPARLQILQAGLQIGIGWRRSPRGGCGAPEPWRAV